MSANIQVRVLHLLSRLVSGGVQRTVLNYAENTKEYGVVFDYVVQGQGTVEIEQKCINEGSRIFRVPDMIQQPLGFSRDLFLLLRKYPEYHVFHVHQNYLNTLPLWIAKIAGVKVRISHSHACRNNGGFVKNLFRDLDRILLNLAATDNWACSSAAYAWLNRKNFPPNDSKSFILHNAVEYEKFTFDLDKRKQIRKSLCIEKNFVCICVGTLSKGKNQSFLLDVIESLSREPHGNYKLILVGEGSVRDDLIKKALDLDVFSRILFLGDRQDVSDLLNAADCALLPSYNEGLPLTLVEAQTNGLPCISSTYVPREVAIRNAIWFEEIEGKDALSTWVSRIKRIREDIFSERFVRGVNTRNDIRTAGFNMRHEAPLLVKKYKKIINS